MKYGIQSAERILMDDKLCIHWDLTKKGDKDINVISVSTSQGSILLTVREIATLLQMSMPRISETLSKTLHTIIVCITELVTIKHEYLIQNNFGHLVQLFCHIHPLDTMASKTRSYLKSCQCPTTKEYRCFGSDARVVNLIAAISKLRYKGNGKLS